MSGEKGEPTDPRGEVTDDAREFLQKMLSEMKTIIDEGGDLRIGTYIKRLETFNAEDNPSDRDYWNIAEYEYIEKGLLNSEENQKLLADEAAEQQIQDEAREQKEKKAGAVMKAMITLLEDSGISGSILSDNDDVARELLAKLFDFDLDKEDTFHTRAEAMGGYF